MPRSLMRRSRQSVRRVSLKYWVFPAALALSALAVASGGDDLRLLLRYDRAELANGQLWRLVTAHVAHLGWQHTGMNMAGLLLVWALFGGSLSLLAWVGVLIASMLAVDAGFWFLNPTLSWYVGLSGALHGLLVAGVVASLATDRLESLVLALLIAAKLYYEQVVGPLPGSVATTGGPVVVDAHLYGAIGGLVAVLPSSIRVRAAPSL